MLLIDCLRLGDLLLERLLLRSLLRGLFFGTPVAKSAGNQSCDRSNRCAFPSIAGNGPNGRASAGADRPTDEGLPLRRIFRALLSGLLLRGLLLLHAGAYRSRRFWIEARLLLRRLVALILIG